MDSPRTPEHDRTKIQYDTPTRAAYLWHANHRRDDESLASIAQQHGIDTATGRRWRALERQHGLQLACRRTRRPLAELNGNKLGRKWTIPEQKLLDMTNPDVNKNTEAPIIEQAKSFGIEKGLSERTIRANLSQRVNARMYVALYTSEISTKNRPIRVQFGIKNKDKPLYRHWDLIYFTDEAYLNPYERLQKPRQLRRRGAPRNKVIQIPPRRPTGKAAQNLILHMYAAVNWYSKSDLYFYNDSVDLQAFTKPDYLKKPRKSKYKTTEQHKQHVKEWQANKPPEVDVDVQGNYMTQKYYTEHVLPQYINIINKARSDYPNFLWILQEDNDPSHGT
jgi:transposase-like protein